MKELKRAEAQGTHVIQVNMSSNYKSDAFVGADWYEVGRLLGRGCRQGMWRRQRQVGQGLDRAGRAHRRRER